MVRTTVYTILTYIAYDPSRIFVGLQYNVRTGFMCWFTAVVIQYYIVQ